MSSLAKIHVLKNKAKLDEDTYRDIVERETGQRSSKNLSDADRLKVIQALEPLAPKQDTSRATGKFAKKLQALWIAGYNLAVINNKSDQAMMAFLRRQTGLDHHRFLQDERDATKAIDALKLWIRRATGNFELFTQDQVRTPLQNDYRFQICLHIWLELVKQDRAPGSSLSEFLASRQAQNDVLDLTSGDWIACMNALGDLYRREGKG
ncbi:MAG: regulatory protein GemA [Roseibium sp.]|uniref:regulatory protein GemA n=1 Tax=Roseibium sp. TaxID=1936156 RepID=UPI00262765E7|nr:regulatory protein GemA [Roseibium sp.]MCV0428858.1 regulatory protein GemA [Roseibium sp.]